MAPTDRRQTGCRRTSLLALALLATAAFVGCNRTSDRTEVFGTVTYQGMPIEKGEIYFIPDEHAPSTMARITNGEYRIVAQGGVPLGTHRVAIKAYRTNSPAGQSELAIGGVGKQYLPPQYNRESELQITIAPDSSDTPQDFHLK